MSDFNDDWQLVGTPDPATPQVQPHQVVAQNAQVQAQPVYPQAGYQPGGQPLAQPVYTQPAQQQPQPAYQQPVNQPLAQPAYNQPVYQQAQHQGYQTVPGFRPAQGYAYPGQAYQQAVDYAAEREKSLAELSRMINHFSPKVDLYQDYEICNADITRYSRTSSANLIWGIIIAVSGLISLVSSVMETKSKDNLIVYVAITSALFLIGAGLIALHIILRKLHAKKRAQLITKAGELSTELILLYNGFSNCQLAPEYTDPRILFKLQSLIMQGRCVTIFNALNSLLIYKQTYIKINAAKTAFAAETSARYDGNPAFFNAYRFLNLR